MKDVVLDFKNQVQSEIRNVIDSQYLKAIDEISRKFFPDKRVDLIGLFIDLRCEAEHLSRDLERSELKILRDELKKINRLIKLEEEKISLMKELVLFVRNEMIDALLGTPEAHFDLNKYYHDSVLMLKACNNLKNQIESKEAIKGKNPYRGTKKHISRLIFVYYDATGKDPICRKKRNEPVEYHGHAYDFLLACKPLLYRLGVNIGTPESLGKIAREIIDEKSFLFE